MWRARYLGQHCRDRSNLLKLLRLQEGGVPPTLKRRASRKPEAPPNSSAEPPLMKAATATPPGILHTPCCGGAAKSAPFHHPASIVPPRHLVPSRHIFSSSKSSFLRPHLGLFTRNASHLVSLRRPEIEKCEPGGLEGSPRGALHGVRRPIRKEPPEDTAAEQQVRHRSNQAVRRQETVPVYQDYARLWPQGTSVERSLKEVLAGGSDDWSRRAQYWQKRQGDWGRYESEGGSQREGVQGVLERMLDERRLDAERLAEEEGTAELLSRISWRTEDLEGDSAAIAADVLGDRPLVEESISEEGASVSDLGQEGAPEIVPVDLGREFSEDEGVGVRAAEAPLEQLHKEQELRGNEGVETRATEPRLERRRGRPPKLADERQRYRMLRQRQHKMEAKSLDTAVKKFQEELNERRKRGMSLGSTSTLMADLFEPLELAIERERNAILNGERGMDRKNYGPYFLLLESDKLAALTLQCVLNAFLMPDNRVGSSHDGNSARDQKHRLAEKGWVKIVNVVMDLGQAVETESNLARLVNVYVMRQRQTAAKKKELERKLKEAAVNATAEGGGGAETGETAPEAVILKKLEELAAARSQSDRQRRAQARAGVEAVMRVYFPDQDSLEVTKQGYRMPPLKELILHSTKRTINQHAKRAIENNTEWGPEVHAKVGAALLQIFLQATEVPPSVFESKRPHHDRLLNAIQRGQIDGVSPEDAPLLFENARIFDKDGRQWNEALEDPSAVPETAVRLDDSASALSDPAQTIAAAASEEVGEDVAAHDATEAAIQDTMREMEERAERLEEQRRQHEERRRRSAEAETSEGVATKVKKKRRGRGSKKAAELSPGGDAAAEVSGTEKAQDMATPGRALASQVQMSASNAVGDAVLAPIVAAVNSNLIQTLDAHASRAQSVAEPVPTEAESSEQPIVLEQPVELEQPVDEETRAAMLEAAIRKFGPEWGHLSVPKKGKQQFRIPAFRHTMRMLKGTRGGPTHKCGVLEVHPAILEKLSQESAALADRFPRIMPMLVEPKPWISHNRGGQLLIRNLIMRTRGSRQQLEALRKASRYPPGDSPSMQSVYDAVNALGSVPWKINVPVSEVVERVWALCLHEGATAGLPRRVLDPLPKKPEGEAAADKTTWREYKRALGKVRQANSDTVSQRGDMTLKITTMHQLREEERFFFPHTVDFRGRAYPIHPYLNHLGSDVCRGMLMFADGRPLGERGLRWLKIHLANLVGNSVDKLSFDEREKYCDQHMAEIMESADRPLEGSRWWMKAEDPFQALAACIEITKAVRSGDPPSYVCALAVHQDGSCNGLQHYAALGKDLRGAEHVNMLAMEKPADVYTGIAETVREKVEADAAKGREVALALRDHVDRKLVKQTVMTSVYGVTFIGARQQIKNRLKEKGVTEDDQLLFQLTTYATKVTLASLGEIFNSARAIMSWLGHSATIISGKRPEGCEEAVSWTTPLGLPVVQPYKRRSKKVVQTVMQSVFLEDEQEDDDVHSLKQRTAFAPNYVHSLDATHMMMTAIACREAGLCFAGVHDSYWTHAGDVERMNEILREKFIELHSQPLLENLLAEFRERFPEAKFPPVPARGEFDVRSVRDAPYFFD